MKKLNKIFKFLVLILPAVLFFSYQPVISLGSGETMNFELSLPLLWLVIFDVVAIVMILRERKLKEVGQKWVWLLFPLFATISIVWSHDKVRGLMTVGILWLLYTAVFAIWMFRKKFSSDQFWRKWLMILFGTAGLVCVWCLVQCILDVCGISRSGTLLCPGCVYGIFGFPHPNGFAAEPQFMGNLLLAPIFVSLYLAVKKKYFGRKVTLALFFAFVVTLFLTLSRGAIYAFLVGLIVFTVYWMVKEKKWKMFVVWGGVLVAFLVALNLQGLLAEVSATNDTYVSGVSKAVNQLTLGVVDLGGSGVKQGDVSSDIEEDEVDSSEEMKEEARFDGYVEISTDTRVSSWKGALEIWSKDFKTAVLGVGFGGAPIARYEEGKYNTPKEIINNEYVNILLEMGLVGISLLVLSLGLVVRAVIKSKNKILVMGLMVAYAVSLCFFSGLPNALHIYLLPVVLMLI